MERIIFNNDDELKDLLLTSMAEQTCVISTFSMPKCLKKSRVNKQLIEEVFSNEIAAVYSRKVIIGANYRNLLKRYDTVEYENKDFSEEQMQLPWGEWVNGTNILIYHKENYYLRVYIVEKNGKKYYIYDNGDAIEENKNRLDEFLPLEKEYNEDQKVIVNNIKLSTIMRIEFEDKILERFKR